MSGLVIALIVADVLMLVALFFLTQRMVRQKIIQLEDVFEERQVIRRLKDEIYESLESTIRDNQVVLQKTRTLAAEAEMEMSSGKARLKEELEELIKGMESRISGPLEDLTRRYAAIEKANKAAARERQLLSRSMQRAEQLIQFLNKDVPYEDIMREIQEKKYSDARFLMAKGMTPDQISRELGLTPSEIKLLAATGG